MAEIKLHKLAINTSESFQDFYLKNFKNVAKTMWGKDNAITGEDLAQEAMIYMWENFFKKKDYIAWDGGFYTPVHQMVWLRTKCWQLISNTEVMRTRSNKFEKINMDIESAMSTLLPEERESFCNAAANVNVEVTKSYMKLYVALLRENFREDIADAIFFTTLGWKCKDVLKALEINTSTYYLHQTAFDLQVIKDIQQRCYDAHFSV